MRLTKQFAYWPVASRRSKQARDGKANATAVRTEDQAARRPYTPRSASMTSAIMAAVRSTNNRAEVALRKAIWARGIRYRLYDERLPGKPDLVFAAARLVVFVDGDFWHGRALLDRGPEGLAEIFRTSNSAFWIAKISKTTDRDARVTRALEGLGYRVLRYWESVVFAGVERIAAEVTGIVSRGRLGGRLIRSRKMSRGRGRR